MGSGNQSSEVANSLASTLKRLREHVPADHITIGILVFLFGFFGSQISMAMGMFAFGFGLLLFTWHMRMRGAFRALIYFVAVIPVLYWFDKAGVFLFPPAHATGTHSQVSTAELLFRYGFAAAAVLGLVIVVRHRGSGRPRPIFAGTGSRSATAAQQTWSNIPKETFQDVGGMEGEKRRIAAIVNNRLHPEKAVKHGVVQNGILLYGPRGTGKTFIARATAGEFKINFWYINPNTFVGGPIGNSEANIREAFQRAFQNRPILLFIDEVDSIGTQRQQLGRDDDRGGAARAYNAIVTELMQCIDRYRAEDGLIIMAATNFYDGLDEALIREMRFDEKIRIDLPDESARLDILKAQLSKRPRKPFALDTFAKRTPGWSAAKLTNLVNKAAGLAAAEDRQIEEKDLRRALEETGGADRPTIKPVTWDDLVLPARVEKDLRQLIWLMDRSNAEQMQVPVPTGLLLIGPPGTGKTSVAQLIATQTKRSFYSITPADAPTPQKLEQIFARARENSPSIVFIDEIDGILPGGNNSRFVTQHQQQIVEQALMLMSQLDPGNQVFLIGTTNHIDCIDPRVLRGGRFSEKIEIGTPDDAGYLRLIQKYLGPIALAEGLTLEDVLERLRGISPADLEALVNTAKRMALNRAENNAERLPPLIWEDFQEALKRNRVHFSDLYR
ncbi:MAG TPA: AAA family ATPase [Terriglobia bacterium]|nr:AAA family ATPase [Terriglobia bacterium]